MSQPDNFSPSTRIHWQKFHTSILPFPHKPCKHPSYHKCLNEVYYIKNYGEFLFLLLMFGPLQSVEKEIKLMLCITHGPGSSSEHLEFTCSHKGCIFLSHLLSP